MGLALPFRPQQCGPHSFTTGPGCSRCPRLSDIPGDPGSRETTALPGVFSLFPGSCPLRDFLRGPSKSDWNSYTCYWVCPLFGEKALLRVPSWPSSLDGGSGLSKPRLWQTAGLYCQGLGCSFLFFFASSFFFFFYRIQDPLLSTNYRRISR